MFHRNLFKRIEAPWGRNLPFPIFPFSFFITAGTKVPAVIVYANHYEKWHGRVDHTPAIPFQIWPRYKNLKRKLGKNCGFRRFSWGFSLFPFPFFLFFPLFLPISTLSPLPFLLSPFSSFSSPFTFPFFSFHLSPFSYLSLLPFSTTHYSLRFYPFSFPFFTWPFIL